MEYGQSRNPDGKPAFVLDAEKIRNAAAIGCTVDEIASILGVARATLYNHMRDDPSIQEAIDTGRATGRATLRRMQWQKANGGSDTMLIWLGKQMLAQTDKNAIGGIEGAPPIGYVVYGVPEAEDMGSWKQTHKPGPA